MQPEYRGLVTELPTQSLKTALDFVRGNKPAKQDLALAAINIQSYTFTQFLPALEQPTVMTADMQSPTLAHAEEAILAVLPDDTGTQKFGIGLATWLVIIRVLAKEVGPILLDTLK
jgi:hypothetical protein